MDLITDMEAFIRDELLSHLQNELNDMQRDPIYEDADIEAAKARLEQVRAYFGVDRQASDSASAGELGVKSRAEEWRGGREPKSPTIQL